MLQTSMFHKSEELMAQLLDNKNIEGSNSCMYHAADAARTCHVRIYPVTGECICTCPHSFNLSNPRSPKCSLVLTFYVGNVQLFLFVRVTHLKFWHVIIATRSFEELKLWSSLNAVFSSFMFGLLPFC